MRLVNACTCNNWPITSADDFLGVEGTYILTSSMSTLSVQIPLIDDEIFELTERLTASIGFFSGEAPPRVDISPDSAEVIIVDDDGT